MSKVSKPKVQMEVLSAKDLPTNLTFDFNCRHPSRGSKAYKEMMKTLQEKPEDFIVNNAGIYIANGKHILDGGHTYLAIQDCKKEGVALDNVFVKVMYLNDLSPKEMAERSIFLNNRTTPPEHGIRDLKGEWELIKNNLNPKYAELIEYRPNTNPNAKFKVGFLAALLHAWTADSAEKSYSDSGQVARYFNLEKHKNIVRKVDTAVELYSQIAKDLAKDKKIRELDDVTEDKRTYLPNGEVLDVGLPKSLVLPVFAAFGKLLNADGEWKNGVDPVKVWQRKKSEMVQRLLKSYRESGRNANRMAKQKDCYVQAQVALLQ